MLVRNCLILSLALFISGKLLSQGCSDPGICTIGSLDASNTKDTVTSLDFTDASLEGLLNANALSEKYKLGLDLAYSDAEKGAVIYNAVLRASYRVKKKMQVDIKVPFTHVNGVLGEVSGVGDITLSMQNAFRSGKGRTISYTIGVVAPTNNSSVSLDGFALPMTYQTSLGAVNVLAGLSTKFKYFSVVLGYQHSFGANKNGFTHEALVFNDTLPGYDPLNVNRQGYMTSRHLRRGNDVMVRVEGYYPFKRFNVTGGFLPIYRLTRSKIESLDGKEMVVDGSDGLTLNYTAGATWLINRHWSLRANFGAPLIRRKARPDGLTRNSVYILALSYRGW